MRLHLDFSVPKSTFSINHHHKIGLIGSCFSENIGNLLSAHKFKTLSNPNGILYNPLSIYNGIRSAINCVDFKEKYIIQRDNLFYSYLHHSRVHSPSKSELIETINNRTQQTHDFIKTCDYLIITFGTAFYYYHLNLKTTVANCHKQPSKLFEKCLSTTENCVKKYSEIIDSLKLINPTLKIIFTVSPVKYLKDGVVENNFSKATLILTVHELMKKNKNCFYFPAYELVNDDLRDYRFYKEDMAHPNEQAINYVWEKFSDCFFDSKTNQLNQHILKLNLAINHRKMQANSSENAKHLDFIAKQKSEIKELFPEMEF